jgi:hypothetical protein
VVGYFCRRGAIRPPEEKPIRRAAIFAGGIAQHRPQNPLNSRRKRKYTDLKMCKSQKRNKTSLTPPRVMLMSSELHNWLLLMDLRGGRGLSQNRPLGPRRQTSRTRFSIPQSFPQARGVQRRWRKLKALRDLPRHFYSVRCRGRDYSSSPVPPSARDSNLVLFFKNAIRTLPMGPFLCLAIMISALPCNSGSSCL